MTGGGFSVPRVVRGFCMRVSHFLVLALVVFVLASFYLGFTPLALSIFLVIFSLVSYALYAKDKSAAQTNGWRVSERTLHTTALLGGWPGALVAQQRLRHKTKKASFRAVFWVTVVVNSAGLVWLHTSQGNTQLRNGMLRVEQAATSHIHQGTGLDIILFVTQLRP